MAIETTYRKRNYALDNLRLIAATPAGACILTAELHYGEVHIQGETGEDLLRTLRVLLANTPGCKKSVKPRGLHDELIRLLEQDTLTEELVSQGAPAVPAHPGPRTPEQHRPNDLAQALLASTEYD